MPAQRSKAADTTYEKELKIRVFELEEAPAAYKYMESGNSMGNIVIRL